IISDTFQKICVCDFMKEEVVTVPYHLPLSVLVEEYFYKYKFNGFPVVDGEEVIGFVNINRIRSVQRDHWTQQTVKSVMIPLEENLVVGLNDNVSKAMEKVFANGVGRVLVMEEDQLKGIVSKTDILNYLRIKTQLQK
ncbi:MAG TPA: hypothetical protein DHN33_09905, partial [Eubacteriaceae bacterium]|nr:hypothetical protein [Eubacteriaceae bacterium]